jgi:biotin operon repressor
VTSQVTVIAPAKAGSSETKSTAWTTRMSGTHRADRLDVLHHDAETLQGWLDAGETPSAIARHLMVDVAEVRAALEAHGLTASTSSPCVYRQLYEPGWLAERLRSRRSLREIAAEVGCSKGGVRAAIRFLEITNRRGYAERHFPQLHDEEWLRHNYLDERKSSTAIAAEVGCGCGSVLRALHRAGIEVRSGPKARTYPQLHDAAWLHRRAVDEGAGTAQLIAEVGCSRTAVHRALHRAGIDISDRASKYPRLHNRSWLRRAYVTEQLSIAQIADQIGCQQRAVRDALRRNDITLRLPPPKAEAVSGPPARSTVNLIRDAPAPHSTGDRRRELLTTATTICPLAATSGCPPAASNVANHMSGR